MRAQFNDLLSRTFNLKSVLLWLATAVVLAVVVWQAVTAYGMPDPDAKNLSPAAVVLSTAVLVFREGLEAILVLAAVTSGLARHGRGYAKSVGTGALLAFLASIATWFIVVAIIANVNAPELSVQAGTGLLAIVVLLLVMNWFFHKIYWTGWIGHHNNRRRRLMDDPSGSASGTFWGLALLGFTAIYREGFEIVLFLQDLRLRAGSAVVLNGLVIGLMLTACVAALTFVANTHLPYKKMLVLTGILLGGVLIVMVGESAQEMQQAGWIGTHAVNLPIPGWMGVWFAVFPNLEGLGSQFLAGLVVIGSYIMAEYMRLKKPAKTRRDRIQRRRALRGQGFPRLRAARSAAHE